MLRLIINTSSNPGDIVLDCFAGSGTTLLTAAQLGRKWIGIDNSEYAIKTIMKRLGENKNVISDYEFLIQDNIAGRYCYRIELKKDREFLVRETGLRYRIKKKEISKSNKKSRKRSGRYIHT
jgi:16S rRNA G966 N2-methylase RsmD